MYLTSWILVLGDIYAYNAVILKPRPQDEILRPAGKSSREYDYESCEILFEEDQGIGGCLSWARQGGGYATLLYID